jgi:UDP:flavonoid glycosyltransferase YjiC (YdhE family)
LAFGLPQLVAPSWNDEFIMAANVVSAGVGLRLSFNRSSASELRRAVFEVLENPAYRLAARRVQEESRMAGGAAAAADALEELLD